MGWLWLWLACAPGEDTGAEPVPCPNLTVTDEVLTWTLEEAGLELSTTLGSVCGTREELTGTAAIIADDFVFADGEDELIYALLPGEEATVRVVFTGSDVETEGELWLDSNDLSRPRLRILLQALQP